MSTRGSNAKKPAAKKVVAKKPAAKKVVAKKPAAKKVVAAKKSSIRKASGGIRPDPNPIKVPRRTAK